MKTGSLWDSISANEARFDASRKIESAVKKQGKETERMNFQSMPELGWRCGYFGVLTVMVFIGIGMMAHFRKKRWL